MIAAGGHPILSDGVRSAGEDNPKGYFEFEQVKSLERDQTWLKDADGKAIKIISFLLPKLPPDYEYRVLFVQRELSEILRSQAQMLARRGQPAGPPDEAMRAHFERHLVSVAKWMEGQRNLQVLECKHAELIRDSRGQVARIVEFLPLPLDSERMTVVVDPTLYRQRGTG
jgi:hypothetical protein